MKTRHLKIAILVSLIVGFLGWEFIETYTPIEFFYEKMMAFSWLLVGFYFVKKSDSTSSRIFATIAFSNLLDELFFNPLTFGFNEVIFVTLVVIMSYFNYKKHPNNAE